jgi:hypothetical protein
MHVGDEALCQVFCKLFCIVVVFASHDESGGCAQHDVYRIKGVQLLELAPARDGTDIFV